jgi:hypothetical protein
MSITLSGHQLLAALDLCNPDGPEDKDQLDTEITIVAREEFVSTDGEKMPAGTYCYFTDYPEEGLCPLLDFPESESSCGKCGNPWADHDFGVPEPSCP